MLIVHRAEARGHEDHGWLDSHHTFNFGADYDTMRMPYGPLRVLNEERLAPGHGYPRHQHTDVEILTYLFEGALQHQDNLGHAALLTPGDVQRLTAGLGVIHTEVNPSDKEPCRFLQIWIQPRSGALRAGHEVRRFPLEERRGRLRLIASPDGVEGSLTLQQDVRVFATVLAGRDEVSHGFAPGRCGWLHLARGHADVNKTPLKGGDGVAIEEEQQVRIRANGTAEVLLLDMVNAYAWVREGPTPDTISTGLPRSSRLSRPQRH